MTVSLGDIETARRRIQDHIIRTPLLLSPTLSRMTGANIYLKLEMLQKAGSFKIRGAANKILRHREDLRGGSVVAASAGNHAQGVAVAAHIAGVPATIVMPEWVSPLKLEATKGYGADVIITGSTLKESIDHALRLAEKGGLFIHPYNDEEVIAGQGTLGLEILDDLPDTDLIVVPVGGGGLIAGIATAAKGRRPGTRVIGVQARECPSAYAALQAGKPVPVNPGPTLADGIRIAATGEIAFPVLQRLVGSVVLVGEQEIEDAILFLLERKRVIVEGAGATPLAALLSGRIPVQPGMNVALVLSGGNIDTRILEEVIARARTRQK
jgi:threonine dehydratase